MGKGSSGKKQNNAARRKRAIYKLEDRRTKNKKRKAHKEEVKQQKLKAKGKGIYAIGCGNHNCKVRKPEGQGTNGRCHCDTKVEVKDGGKSGTTE